MKKTYNNPTMKVVKIQARHKMMTGSLNVTISGEQANKAALGRDFDFDFDFDDEEE